MKLIEKIIVFIFRLFGYDVLIYNQGAMFLARLNNEYRQYTYSTTAGKFYIDGVEQRMLVGVKVTKD